MQIKHVIITNIKKAESLLIHLLEKSKLPPHKIKRLGYETYTYKFDWHLLSNIEYEYLFLGKWQLSLN